MKNNEFQRPSFCDEERPLFEIRKHIHKKILNAFDYRIDLSADTHGTNRIQIGDKGCKNLSEALKYNHFIKEVNLLANNITDEGCKYLGEGLQVNPSIKELTLKGNYIGDEGCRYISEGIKHNRSLIKLDLSVNDIGAEGCQHLKDALLENTTMQYINISGNPLDAEAWLSLRHAAQDHHCVVEAEDTCTSSNAQHV